MAGHQQRWICDGKRYRTLHRWTAVRQFLLALDFSAERAGVHRNSGRAALRLTRTATLRRATGDRLGWQPLEHGVDRRTLARPHLGWTRLRLGVASDARRLGGRRMRR